MIMICIISELQIYILQDTPMMEALDKDGDENYQLWLESVM